MVKKIVLWTLVIGCMALIFFFSSQPANDSMDLSDGLLHSILRFLHINLSEEIITFMRVFIRKVAHFVIYTLLGFNAYLLFKVGYELYIKKALGLTLAMCAFYAVTDEIHQLFVPGRSGMLKDVLIDTSGAACGMLIACAICFLISRRRKNG